MVGVRLKFPTGNRRKTDNCFATVPAIQPQLLHGARLSKYTKLECSPLTYAQEFLAKLRSHIEQWEFARIAWLATHLATPDESDHRICNYALMENYYRLGNAPAILDGVQLTNFCRTFRPRGEDRSAHSSSRLSAIDRKRFTVARLSLTRYPDA